MSKLFQRRESASPSTLKLDPQFVKKVTALLNRARIEIETLFEPWWASKVPIVEKKAVERDISAQMSVARQVQTVHDCAFSLAINARVNAAISASMQHLNPEKDPQLQQLIDHLVGGYLDADAANQTEYRNIVGAYGINPAMLLHYFTTQTA